MTDILLYLCGYFLLFTCCLSVVLSLFWGDYGDDTLAVGIMVFGVDLGIAQILCAHPYDILTELFAD